MANGQTLEARISIVSVAPARVEIEGKRKDATRLWSFRNTYAGVNNLGERIEKLRLMTTNGAEIAVRKLAPGEYEAEQPAENFSYEVNLEAPSNTVDAAYVSWLSATRGVLMLGDLLPHIASETEIERPSVAVRFALPATWKISTIESRSADTRFETKDSARAVFFVGQDLRERQQSIGAMNFTVVTSGEWAFSDEDVVRVARDVLREHVETNGGAPRESAMLMLAPFPRALGATRWSAETRGGTTLLLLGQSPSRTAALAQLSVPLAHELFHLWVPNGLALDGNYDWFYEGFTQYEALRACVRLELLTFDDYLSAIGRAFDAYRAIGERDKLSLIDVAERRWTSVPGLIYSKGLLIAFLYDLTLRQRTNGKRSLDDVYREMFRRYRSPNARTNGNAAVIKALNEAGDTQDFAREYVEKARAIDLTTVVEPFGLRVEQIGAHTHLATTDALNHKQRDLLQKLGYNKDERARSGHAQRSRKQ